MFTAEKPSILTNIVKEITPNTSQVVMDRRFGHGSDVTTLMTPEVTSYHSFL